MSALDLSFVLYGASLGKHPVKHLLWPALLGGKTVKQVLNLRTD